MNEMFSQGGKGSTGILTNKQAVARYFGVKQSEVVYFSVGAVLSGYKVIYDKETQRAYSLPADIAPGTTAISLSTAAVLVHSAGSVDLGALAVSREEYVTLPGSFDSGSTLNVKNELLTYTDGKYRWDGALPKIVPADSTPTTTGGVGDGAWVSVGDAALRSDLSSSSSGRGASLVNLTSGNSVQEEIDFLAYAYGVRLSNYMADPDPLTAALADSRNKKLPLIIDCDATYKTFLVYSNDRIIGCGDHTLTKIGNDKPSIPSAQQPERPSGTTTDFSSIDAGIVIVHPDNGSATNIIISGFNLANTSHCDYAIHCTFMSFTKIEDMKFNGYKRGIKWYNAYGNQLSRIFSLYYYSTSDVFSDFICYDFSDGNYSSGTSNTITNVTCTNYKKCYYVANLNYSTFTNCGGEGVESPTPVSTGNIPQTFEFVNCPNIVLNTPYTENLRGGFIRAVSDASGVYQGASTIVINGPEAVVGITGTTTNVGAKLLDIQGGVNCVVNGGYMTGAASGYFLEFGGADGDATLLINGMEMRNVLEQIRSHFGYNGINSIKGLRPMQLLRKGIGDATGTGIVNWKTASEDQYFMGGGNFTKTALGGYYQVDVEVPIGTNATGGEVTLLLSDTDTDSGVAIAQCYVPAVSTGRYSARLRYEGRLPGGKFLYVKTTVGWSSVYDTDAVFNVILK
ncbi:putative tail spike protein [Salmonella phage BSP101]|uniref:Putative tail spike protein n=1 Tax=Salmonella phage BSP101 TaxID=1958914 RepID=A0A2P0QGN7_9CAUD|nr:tail spike protein [Salmonella phage BSP101]ARM69920.1 putative tail spike protein [Salmonella phage BSP101]